jgi:hypothetical protein
LLNVFAFIHRNIFLNDYSSSEFNAEEFSSDTEILTHFLGRNIAKETCTMISKYYLSRVVPTDINGLREFSSIASAATHLEDELIALGKIAFGSDCIVPTCNEYSSF